MASVRLTASAFLVSEGALVLSFQKWAEDDVPDPLATKEVAVLATLSAVSPKSENLLKEECKKIEGLHGIKAFDPVTGETKHTYGVILRIMQESQSSARLNSFYRPERSE